MNRSVLQNKKITRRRIEVYGYVQGIGFRPFVYRLAKNHQLTGFVLNDYGKVIIEVQGKEENIINFIDDLQQKKPSLSQITKIKIEEKELQESESEFKIQKSNEDNAKAFSDILPDIAICDDCKHELLNPHNERYFFPFITCTHCGPRYTIIENHPYDRIQTTMAVFDLCENCQEEYHNPEDRRFHAETIACHQCGPIYILLSKKEILGLSKNETLNYIQNQFKKISSSFPSKQDRIKYNQSLIFQIIEILQKPSILAIKGIGGYHLACDPFHDEVTKLLRERKKRKQKPFALMFKDISSIEAYAYVNEEEKALLLSPQAPIVLLRSKFPFSSYVIPRIPGSQNYIGAFLPYAPMHFLIMHFYQKPLIMTSGNLSDEPIFYQEDENFLKIFELADYVLIHNRRIHTRCDDSVIKVHRKKSIIFRMSRGYTPKVFSYDKPHKPILALGGELKNSISILVDHKLITSHYIGDLDNWDTFQSFLETMQLFKKLYRFEPEFIVADYHPNYLSTQWAKEKFSHQKEKILFVQHHHSHIAACMWENHLQNKVLGIALDGTGFGITKDHPEVVGGEVYLADYLDFKHLGSLLPMKLIGGEKAIKEVDRIGTALLYEFYQYFYKDGNFWEWFKSKPYLAHLFENSERIRLLLSLMEKNLSLVSTSSCGRLFDGISAILNVCLFSDYEGQAAISLEQIIQPQDVEDEKIYSYKWVFHQNGIRYLDWRYILRDILLDLESGASSSLIALRFHRTLAKAYSDLVLELSQLYSVYDVVLTGGCFQNTFLLDFFEKYLFTLKVHTHKELPPGDGSLSIGQILIANERLMKGGENVFSNSYESYQGV
ncbi:MAG: carbamoyltransferase HypF [Leptospiraceae bacterium]|nr:carbamoyltransferase HypF [Leptospiraceae bacterium]MDW7976342.1 carbamoyltransferase HypF [Leptospiraceae bacterium]